MDGLEFETPWGRGRFFSPLQTSSGEHLTFYSVGSGTFPGVKSSERGVALKLTSGTEDVEGV
jgi:hypothetical protein